MPEIKRTFNRGIMNRDLDDRLLPAGTYREALNISVGNSESSDMGAVENLLGNKLVGNTITGNNKCIGSYRDNGSERIYFYTTTNNSYDNSNSGTHAIYSYDQKSKQLKTLVSGTTLNFHQNFPITGINLVDDLLFWTDNRNPPRKINVVRAANDNTYYTTNANFDDLASVAKLAPYLSPTILNVGTTDESGSTITSNFLENKLIRFSYRWKFEDGEYSTLAPFSPICFSRLTETDTINSSISNFGEVETFVNAIKSVQLQIPTPPNFGITEVELIYKETGSSALYVVEDKPVGGESFINFFYVSQDPFKTLPPDQLTRVYDAVPRLAVSQQLVGGRLVYGNFLQNYDIPTVDFSVVRTGETSARHNQLENLSVKSRRTYQVGIVLADKFGRQSPVILSNSGGDTVFVDAGTGAANSTTAFNALRISFSQATINELQALGWAYSYRIVVKQREQEYYNWISVINSQDTVARLGDSINKIPRDQTAVIPPSTSSSISPTNVFVFPKILSGANSVSTTLTKVRSIANPSGDATVSTGSSTSGLAVFETKPVESDLDIFYETSTGGLISTLTTTAIDIDFFNCCLLNFSSGTHIETNRLRVGFNQQAFDVGVRAFVVQENFAEERRFNTLIHSSGLFNSRTGINYVNQFNESEGGLTVSVDPQNGSIQKLDADDTQLLIFQEDKVSRSPIDKDFIYSAEGGAIPVTSNTQFLGTVAPFAGEFGIAKNPQSYASFGFNKFFTDKNKGAVLMLNQGGSLSKISDAGMSDFFRDALKISTDIIGSYDEYSGVYNLSLKGTGFDGNKDTNVATASDDYLTLSYDPNMQGWTSFVSFKPESGVSLNNTYYTFSSGNLWEHNSLVPSTRNNFYGIGTQKSYIEPIFNDSPSTVKQFNTIGYEGTEGWEITFLETDIESIGTIPSPSTTISNTLQTSGNINNASISGEETIIASQGDVITWIITASPISGAYKFNSVGDVVLSGTDLTIVNPSSITSDGNIVFRVSYTVTNSDVIKTLNISGNGAVLANLPALLTINTTDAVALADLTPASQVFTASGSANVVFSLLANEDYYIDPASITVNTSGSSSFNPGSATTTRLTAPSPAKANNNDNAQYSIPLTVPSTVSTGTIAVSGTAVAKTNLTWVTPTATYMTFTTSGNNYKVSKFDTTNATATLTYTNIPANKTMTPGSVSFAVSQQSGGASIPSSTTSTIDAGTNFSAAYNVQITEPSTDITAVITITGGVIDATMGSYTAPSALPAVPGSDVPIASSTNVLSSATQSDSWILINGSSTAVQLNPFTSFFINTTENTTGSVRTGTITLSNLNTRISPALSDVVINITQNG